MTAIDAHERVARGAALLDQTHPGWAQQIDLDMLNLSSLCGCILGQLCGTFDAGCQELFPGRDWYQCAMDHGFEAPPVYRDGGPSYIRGRRAYYRLLQDAWVAEIASRVVVSEQPADVEVTA